MSAAGSFARSYPPVTCAEWATKVAHEWIHPDALDGLSVTRVLIELAAPEASCRSSTTSGCVRSRRNAGTHCAKSSPCGPNITSRLLTRRAGAATVMCDKGFPVRAISTYVNLCQAYVKRRTPLSQLGQRNRLRVGDVVRPRARQELPERIIDRTTFRWGIRRSTPGLWVSFGSAVVGVWGATNLRKRIDGAGSRGGWLSVLPSV